MRVGIGSQAARHHLRVRAREGQPGVSFLKGSICKRGRSTTRTSRWPLTEARTNAVLTPPPVPPQPCSERLWRALTLTRMSSL